MKQILLFTSIIWVLILSGCTVSPSMLGNNIAGLGVGEEQKNQSPAILAPMGANPSSTAGPPPSTGSIVPLNSEGTVVDLPDSSVQKRASSPLQPGQPAVVEDGISAIEGEQASSAAERHRRELINRGDLREGQPLPVE